jgi:predicted RNA-binding Zn ribbon-like protein
MTFDSHVLNLVDVASRLVNALTPGLDGGHQVALPDGPERVDATAEALGGNGRPTPHVTTRQATSLAAYAAQMRRVFDATDAGDLAEATRVLNRMLKRTGARPQLDPLPDGGWHVHFHGSTDGLATGWAAGCATGLALAIGSDLAGRLGLCEAERCDRVFVDTSKNAGRRFCSTSCQNRTKTQAYRARRGLSPGDEAARG